MQISPRGLSFTNHVSELRLEARQGTLGSWDAILQPEEARMRYILFSSALILSFELLGASIATAMLADSAIVKANSNSREVIQVLDGCGHHQHRNRHGHGVHY
jgi:hypothetical protein